MGMKKSVKATKTNKLTGAFIALSTFFYKHLLFSAAFWLSLVMFGVLSYTSFMQRQGFPSIEVPISVVRSTYFVNDRSVVDTEVTKPLLSAIEKVDSLKSTEATSTDNTSVIVVEFEGDVTSQQGADRIESKLRDVTLPDGASAEAQPVFASRFNNDYDVVLSVFSDKKNVLELSNQATYIADELQDTFPQTEVEVITQLQQGTNPQTGQAVTQQTQFDLYGVQRGDEISVESSVGVGIALPDDQDIISFDNALQDELSSLRDSKVLDGSDVQVAADFASSIRQQVSSLQQNLATGLVLVVLVCCIFIGIRAGLIAALGMGVTLTTTIGALYLSGLTLNTITLFALILTLGLIVDDTIIVTEALESERAKGGKPLEAIKVAIKRIALASLAGTLTTMLGFAPLLFIGGILGDFIRVMPITIITSLAVSFIVSITFIPFMSHWLAKDEGRRVKHSPLRAFRDFESRTAALLVKPLKTANTTRKKLLRSGVAIVISIAFMLAGGYYFSQLNFNIFPSTKDTNALILSLDFAPGTSLSDAELKAREAIGELSDTIGQYVTSVTFIGAANERGATARITLTDYGDRGPTSHDLIKKVDDSLTSLQGVSATLIQLDPGPPQDEYPFKVQLVSEDPAISAAAGTKLAEHLDGLQLDRSNGTTATITDVEFVPEQPTIQRTDGKRIMQVSAQFDGDDVSALVLLAEDNVKEFIKDSSNRAGLDKSDYQFDFGNESENQESFRGVMIAFPILVLCMFILLAIQFKSLLQPLLIMFATPFSFFGVGLGLYLTNNPLSFFVMIGFFALIGISVNNTILLTDYANQERRAGLTPRAAIASAAQKRFRPLITTSLTSVLALLPLALSEPFWESIAFTLMFGLLSSTLLVVTIFPYYYLVAEVFRTWFAKKRAARKKRKS